MKCLLIYGFGMLIVSMGWAQSEQDYQTSRSGRIFQVFQFPRDQMPRIDGDVSDWDIVPVSYVYTTQELKDTEDGMSYPIDTSDLKVSVAVGWVNGLNRLYFRYVAYDDYWDFGRFNPEGYQNDIFEVVVDGDLSGGPFIFNPMISDEYKWNDSSDTYLENHMRFSGVHAQNYHIYTPPVRQTWTLIWGSQPWIQEFPYANFAYSYDFQPGEPGTLILECWITPFDYAPSTGPGSARVSDLRENEVIGLSWSVLDFDGEKREGHVNLAHDTRMVKNADYLCAFRLMPLEKEFVPDIRAEWTYEVIDAKTGLVAFIDQSIGEISRWKWDFGDGHTSDEQHPIHQFTDKSVHRVITLEVVGAEGTSMKTRYWEVLFR